ncbi:transposase [Streptomyces sp. NPDC050263]|uniref:transposase n=1 Tax=Streptomyces sp. NPDC050263 TaxID=3155037 RepID=UPI0034308912
MPAWLQGKGGRPEGYCRRVMLDAIRYVVDNGVKWASLPADFPPYRRVPRLRPPLAAGGSARRVPRRAARPSPGKGEPDAGSDGRDRGLAVGAGGCERPALHVGVGRRGVV